MNLNGLIRNRLCPKVKNILLFKIGALPGIRPDRPLPIHSDGRVLVHFGCGIYNDPRYINVDARPGWHIHYVDTIENCSRLFPADSVDLVYGCHILEHVSHQKLPAVLRGVQVSLKPGGVFRISVPNFETIASMYREKGRIEDIMEPLMGGQGYPENFHASLFDERFLTKLLLESGFCQVRRWDPRTAPDHAFDDWSGRPFPLYGKNWPISLNLEGVK